MPEAITAPNGVSLGASRRATYGTSWRLDSSENGGQKAQKPPVLTPYPVIVARHNMATLFIYVCAHILSRSSRQHVNYKDTASLFPAQKSRRLWSAPNDRALAGKRTHQTDSGHAYKSTMKTDRRFLGPGSREHVVRGRGNDRGKASVKLL